LFAKIRRVALVKDRVVGATLELLRPREGLAVCRPVGCNQLPEILAGQMETPFFPVSMAELPGRIEIE